jgi:hypothetical protein
MGLEMNVMGLGGGCFLGYGCDGGGVKARCIGETAGQSV